MTTMRGRHKDTEVDPERQASEMDQDGLVFIIKEGKRNEIMVVVVVVVVVLC